MAQSDELVPGNCYFHVNYYDDKFLFPSIDTLTFVRADEYESGERVWIFQFPSELEESGGTDSSANGEWTLVGFTDEQLYQILDFSRTRIGAERGRGRPPAQEVERIGERSTISDGGLR
jgi:hypothetical protein